MRARGARPSPTPVHEQQQPSARAPTPRPAPPRRDPRPRSTTGLSQARPRGRPAPLRWRSFLPLTPPTVPCVPLADMGGAKKKPAAKESNADKQARSKAAGAAHVCKICRCRTCMLLSTECAHRCCFAPSAEHGRAATPAQADLHHHEQEGGARHAQGQQARRQGRHRSLRLLRRRQVIFVIMFMTKTTGI